jgi:hypothetical protein
MKVSYAEKHSHLDLTHATGCKHPRLRFKSRRMRWSEYVARTGEKRNTYRLLVGKPEGRRPLGRQRRRWVDNIKMDILEIGWDGMDWIDLAQDRDKWRALVKALMNLRVP